MRKALMLVLVGCAASAASGQVLVYDANSNNHYGRQGAEMAGLGAVTVASASDFNTLLTSGTWKAVAIDAPSSIPSDSWATLASFVSGGSTPVVMSFWQWNGAPFAALRTAFGITGTQTLSTAGRTLTADGGALGAQVFSGVPGMPHSSWSDSWGDDGDAFATSGGTPIAFLNGFTDPVMFRGNGGRSIASFVIDEWAGDGAPILWKNMIGAVVPAPSTGLALGLAALAAGRRRR